MLSMKLNKLRNNHLTDPDHVHILFFTSRNKDNPNLPEFRQRHESFLINKEPEFYLERFQNFVDKGVPNELSRMYVTITARSQKAICKALQHELIDKDVNLIKFDSKLVSLASKPQCIPTGYTPGWMFDFDKVEHMDIVLKNFLVDLRLAYEKTRGKREAIEIDVYPTMSGYAIIPSQKFDTRELLAKYQNVELKKDPHVFLGYSIKESGDKHE